MAAVPSISTPLGVGLRGLHVSATSNIPLLLLLPFGGGGGGGRTLPRHLPLVCPLVVCPPDWPVPWAWGSSASSASSSASGAAEVDKIHGIHGNRRSESLGLGRHVLSAFLPRPSCLSWMPVGLGTGTLNNGNNEVTGFFHSRSFATSHLQGRNSSSQQRSSSNNNNNNRNNQGQGGGTRSRGGAPSGGGGKRNKSQQQKSGGAGGDNNMGRSSGKHSSEPDGSTEIRLARADGTNSLMTFDELNQEAQRTNLVVTCVAAHTTPPVYRLVDVAKQNADAYRRERERKTAMLEQRRTQTTKEVKLRAGTAENDANRARDQAASFLEQGYRVKVTVTQRRIDPPDSAKKMLERFTTLEHAKLMGEPRMEGASKHVCVLAPDKEAKQKKDAATTT